jgi:hypothetical protein
MKTAETRNAPGMGRFAEAQAGDGLQAQDSAAGARARSEFGRRTRSGPRPIREILAGLTIIRELAIRMMDPRWPTAEDLARARAGLARVRVTAQREFKLEPLQ